MNFPIGNPYEDQLKAWEERRSSYRAMVQKAMKKQPPFDEEKRVDIPLLEFNDTWRTKRWWPTDYSDKLR